MPVLARRRHEIGEPFDEPKRRQFDTPSAPGRVDFRPRPKQLGTSLLMSVIRTLASIEKPLFSHLSMSAAGAAAQPARWTQAR
jgi:hypothetical protein